MTSLSKTALLSLTWGPLTTKTWLFSSRVLHAYLMLPKRWRAEVTDEQTGMRGPPNRLAQALDYWVEQSLSRGPFISTRPCLIQGLKLDSEAQSEGMKAGDRVRGETGRVRLLFTQRGGVLLLFIGILEFKKRHSGWTYVLAERNVWAHNWIVKENWTQGSHMSLDMAGKVAGEVAIHKFSRPV